MMKYEVVVNGGGTWGWRTAYPLARMGKSVAVTERGSVPYGQRGYTSAIIRQFCVNPSTAKMARMSLEFFRHFSEHAGYSASFKQTGMLAISDDADALKRMVEVMRSEGIRSQMIDEGEAHLLEPPMTVAEDETVAYEPDAGFANPVATALDFSCAAESPDAKIYQETEVLGIEGKSTS
jgi:sarcosine oxidase subunit beta